MCAAAGSLPARPRMDKGKPPCQKPGLPCIKDIPMPQTEIGSSERLLEELKTWVLHETPTTDASAVNGLIGKAEAELRAVGAAIERIPG